MKEIYVNLEYEILSFLKKLFQASCQIGLRHRRAVDLVHFFTYRCFVSQPKTNFEGADYLNIGENPSVLQY